MSFADEIRNLKVTAGTVAIVWLGQAGYLLKSPADQIIMIDPYLSEWALEQWGLLRAIPPVFDPADLQPDILLISHWHEDHMDVPVIKEWTKSPHVGAFCGPLSCTARAQAWGWPASQITTLADGDTWTSGDVTVLATFARHDVPAAPCPDAIGFIMEIAGLRIWNVADSEYDAHLRALGNPKVDLAFLPINGVGGNMNVHEAALLAWQTQPRVVIPMHYNMWKAADFGPGATLDPGDFSTTLTRLGGGPEVQLLEVGTVTVFPRVS